MASTTFRAAAYGEGTLSDIVPISVTVPVGAQAGDLMVAVFGWSTPNDHIVNKTGWEIHAPETTFQNSVGAILSKTYTSGSTVEFLLSSATSVNAIVGIAWYDGSLVSAVESAGTVGSRGGVTQNFVIAPGLTSLAAPRYVISISGTRSGATTAFTSADNSFVLDAYGKSTDPGNATSISFTGGVSATTSVPAVTHTYNGSSGNAFAQNLVLEPVGVADTGIVTTAFVPRFDNTSITVGAMFTLGTTYRLVCSTDPALSSPIYFDGDISADKWTTATATGLTPNTKYYFGFEIDSILQTDYIVEGYTTGGTPSSFVALAGSCQVTGSNHASIARMATEGARFLCHMGDIHYADATTVAAWRTGLSSSMTSANQKTMMKVLPMDYIWDNHDRVILGDLNSGPTDPVTNTAYRELAGNNYSDTQALYRTWTVGRVRFIHTDNWTVRDDPDTIPDTDFKPFAISGTKDALVLTSNSPFSLTNHDSANGGSIKFLQNIGAQFTSGPGGTYTIARGLSDNANNTHSFRGVFMLPTLPAAALTFMYIRQNVNDNAVLKLRVMPTGALQLRDGSDAQIGSDIAITAGKMYHVTLVMVGGSTTTGQATMKLYEADGKTQVGATITTSTANMTVNPINGFELGITSVNAATSVNWYDAKIKDGRTTELPVDGYNSMLGFVQRNWLKDVLYDAQEPVIVWFCAFPNHNAQNGRWNSFDTETQALGSWIASKPSIHKRLIMIGGDSHDLRADSGTRTVGRVEDGSPIHNFIGIPTLNVSGIDQGSDTLWDTGNWDIAQAVTGAGSGSYSRLTFTDNNMTIQFKWEAINGTTGAVMAIYERKLGTMKIKNADGSTTSAVIGTKVSDTRKMIGAELRIKS